MEIIVILLVVVGVVYFFLKMKERPQGRSEILKKEELIIAYKKRFEEELSGIDEREFLIEKKTKLLQTFASELNRNIFFDNEEAKALIEELARS